MTLQTVTTPTHTQSASPTAALAAPSLFERLGKADGIRALVDDIVAEHMKNPSVSARFLPYAADPARLAKVKEHTCAFLAAGSGGPQAYAGRGMLEAHRGMNISAAEYLAAVDDIITVLRRHSIDEQTQKDVLAIAYALKGDIMHR